MFKKDNFIPICITSEQANVACRHYGFTKYEIVHNGLDISKIKKQIMSKADSRKVFGFTNDSFIIGSVGRLDKIKRYDMLINKIIFRFLFITYKCHII